MTSFFYVHTKSDKKLEKVGNKQFVPVCRRIWDLMSLQILAQNGHIVSLRLHPRSFLFFKGFVKVLSTLTSFNKIGLMCILFTSFNGLVLLAEININKHTC